jgi:menaquinone-dependent protoporphyrinogen IX oxidase
MNVLIVYASWFGHNRSIAKLIAAQLARSGMQVTCVSAGRAGSYDLADYDMVVLGTNTHDGRAHRRLRALCESIPRHQFERQTIALFGTQLAQPAGQRGYSGADELAASLAARGCELALPPLHIQLPGAATFLPWPGLSAADRRQVKEYAAELWEAGVPEPFI